MTNDDIYSKAVQESDLSDLELCALKIVLRTQGGTLNTLRTYGVTPIWLGAFRA